MIYLTGATNNAIEPLLIERGIGLMCQPGNSYHARITRYPWWGADNGAFGGNWTEDKHMDWLAALPRQRCLFAVSPDEYGNAVESLRRGLEFAPIIRDMGFPVAVVAQDGAERLTWPWEEIDCLFIGGERKWPGQSEWKESPEAETLVWRARNAGLWVHMGRVNTQRRLLKAWRMGVLSCDGTLIKHLRRALRGETAGERDERFEGAITRFMRALDVPPLPLYRWETPSHPHHRTRAGETHEAHHEAHR